MKNFFINTFIVFVSVIATFIVAEIAFRFVLKHGGKQFDGLRKPELYADWNNDELYWKLRIEWKISGSFIQHKSLPHLGWRSHFNTDNFNHHDDTLVKKRKRVLWFGDSFSQCVAASTCFQTILNNDSVFSKKYYLLNYGTGGYGLDQITYLIQKAIEVNDSPFVVFGFLPTDIDRSMLSIRDMPKPFYSIKKDSLIFHEDHLTGTTEEYVNKTGLGFTSLLWRKLLFSTWMNEQFPRLSSKLRMDGATEQKKKILNEKLIHKTISMLQEKKIPFVVLVFAGWEEYLITDDKNWRYLFVKETFNKLNVPFIWTNDLVNKNLHRDVPNDIQRFLIPGDGHPTTYYNKLISEEVKEKMYKILNSQK